MKLQIKVIAAVLMLTLIGCSDGKTNIDSLSTQNAAYKIATSDDSFTVAKDNYISQPYWSAQVSGRTVTKIDNIYYNIMYGCIFFSDFENDEMIYLCNKPDCEHNSKECNADLPDGFSYNEIVSADNHIYLIKHDNKDIYLVDWPTDGSGEYKELFKVGECIEEDKDDFPSWKIITDGEYIYVYSAYPYYADTQPCITRYSLTDGKGEVITGDQFGGEGMYITCARLYGEKLFYSLQSLDIEKYCKPINDDQTGIFVYDTDTGETIQLFRGESVRSFAVNEEKNEIYYYSADEGLKKVPLDKLGETPEVIVKTDDNSTFVDISYDGKYIYTDNAIWCNMVGADYQLNIYSTEGNLVNSIAYESYETIEMGDSDVLFTDSKYLKKSSIETAKFSDFKEFDDIIKNE